MPRPLLLSAASVVVCGVCRAAAAPPRGPPPLQRRAGASEHCVRGRRHTLTYDTVGAPDDMFVTLDPAAVASARCDLDDTHVEIRAHDPAAAQAIVAEMQRRFAVYGQAYLAGADWGGGMTCRPGTNDSNAAGSPPMVLRRILDYVAEQGSTLVDVHAVVVKYDEIFQDANVTLGPTPGLTQAQRRCAAPVQGAAPRATTPFCLGVNVDTGFSDPDFCEAAAGVIPLFNEQLLGGLVGLDAECSNCFLGFEWDVMFGMQIRHWKVEQFAAGFLSMKVTGALEVTMTASASGNYDLQKTLNLLPGGTASLDFRVGVIPFHASFQVPVDVSLSASFGAQATATVGTDLDWFLGDNYVKWEPSRGWSHVKNGLGKIGWTPVHSASRSFSAQAQLQVVPRVLFDVENAFHYSLTMNPTWSAAAQWVEARKKVCVSVDASLQLVEQAQLRIDVPFAHMALAKQWGPYTFIDWKKRLLTTCAAPQLPDPPAATPPPAPSATGYVCQLPEAVCTPAEAGVSGTDEAGCKAQCAPPTPAPAPQPGAGYGCSVTAGWKCVRLAAGGKPLAACSAACRPPVVH